jgi:hypothetical protein
MQLGTSCDHSQAIAALKTYRASMTARFALPILLIASLIASGIAGAQSGTPPAFPPIDALACKAMKIQDVLRHDAPVGCDKLALVRFSYIDFEGRTRNDGEIMVMAAAADFVKTIFDQLYLRRFPIAKARLMDRYSGNDAKAMADNNTSAFNHRVITGGNLPSLHAYGLAIDLNPIQNPYIEFEPVGRATYRPARGTEFANRSRARPGKAARRGMAEEVVDLFAENGFTIWGGDWDNPIDYQHFQVERTLAERMARLPTHQAQALFAAHVQAYRDCLKHDRDADQAIRRKRCTENRSN